MQTTEKNPYLIFPLIGIIFSISMIRLLHEPWNFLFFGFLLGFVVPLVYSKILKNRQENKKVEADLFAKRIKLEKEITDHQRLKNKKI